MCWRRQPAKKGLAQIAVADSDRELNVKLNAAEKNLTRPVTDSGHDPMVKPLDCKTNVWRKTTPLSAFFGALILVQATNIWASGTLGIVCRHRRLIFCLAQPTNPKTHVNREGIGRFYIRE